MIKEFAFPVISGLNPVVANIMALKAYIVVNFRAREISRDARKLVRISTLIKIFLFNIGSPM